VEFDYHSAESQGRVPAFLNEAFLVEARRADGPAPSGLTPTPPRALRFTYAWGRNSLDEASLRKAVSAAWAFWEAQYNCTFTPVDSCLSKGPVAFNLADFEAAAQDMEANFLSTVADNILRVDNAGVVESETRYDVDVSSLAFDKAVRQRWGSRHATPMPSVAPDWDTQLPEARLEYSEATPTQDGQDDVTTAFLPPALAARYGLESFPSEALEKARRTGMLLSAHSPDGVVIPNAQAPIAEGTFVPSSDAQTQAPACLLQKLPVLRTRLPGYRPSLEYFDLTPQASDADSNTPGLHVGTFQLKRSRLSCEVLARAQTFDARTTDALWTWKKVQGAMVPSPLLGRRQYLTLNANRICAWVHEVNRDGASHYRGLNFQGRLLVDAVAGADGRWRFAETLYNADGNVIAQRRPLPEGVPWSDGQGDTRLSYFDEAAASAQAFMPWPWARRGNLLKCVFHESRSPIPR
jgi:hypothetical protein